MLGLSLCNWSARAIAQEGEGIYVGAYICSSCHDGEYAHWYQHGHAWMQVHTGGQVPPADLFAPIGEELPVLPTDPADPSKNITWDMVQDIFGHFRDGHGYLLLTNGKRVVPPSTTQSTMPGRCNKCHNTGFDPAGHAYSTPTLTTGIEGSWALNSIQCEQCHGPGPAMEDPDLQVCRDCHSSGDFGTKLGPDPAQVGFRIAFDPVQDVFSGHHGEGDEYRRSPHKNMGCLGCHEPHMSVWKDKGGVKTVGANGQEHSIGNMCLICHSDKRVRGSMGEMGMECIDCHMPESSALGHRHTHLFRINTEPLDSVTNWKEELSDSNTVRKYWKNFDGTTGAGDSFITVDMACGECHENRTVEQLSKTAKYIHRQPGLIDLTINGGDNLQVVTKTSRVSVDFAVYTEEVEEAAGASADWYVLAQGPKGWTYWNGRAWKKGLRAWRRAPIADIKQNVLNAPLAVGSYTYWVQIDVPNGGEFADSVPVYVKKR
jgi:hypothetical protein